MRQQFYKRREKYTSSNITSGGAYNTARVKPKIGKNSSSYCHMISYPTRITALLSALVMLTVLCTNKEIMYLLLICNIGVVGGGEERSPPVLNEVPIQPSGVNKQFLYEKRLADIEAKVYGHRTAFANRKLLSCQTSSSQLPSHWNKSHHNTGKDKIEIDTTTTTSALSLR